MSTISLPKRPKGDTYSQQREILLRLNPGHHKATNRSPYSSGA
jgi:hypothetical protein